MLLVISDLHLTDNTTGETVSVGAFRLFRTRLAQLAHEACKHRERVNGTTYQPMEYIDIILLGDILDLIRSTRWGDRNGPQPDVRPWDDPQSADYVAKISTITDEILAFNAEACAVLRSLSQDPIVTTHGYDAAPIPVRLHYMIGNHDWMLHLPGPEYDAIRQRVIDAMGLCHPDAGPFPHAIDEDGITYDMLADACERHNLYPRHGDIYDMFNYDEKRSRDASTLGDALVVELINRFPVAVREAIGGGVSGPEAQLHRDYFFSGLAELANVRPNLLVPVWIDSLMRNTGLMPTEAAKVKDVWNQLAGDFIDHPFVRERDTILPFETVDLLQEFLRLTRNISVAKAASISRKLNRLQLSRTQVYEHAKKDLKRSKTVDFVVYGHTHHHELTPLNRIEAAGNTYKQLYLNSGTWKPVHELTRQTGDSRRFVDFHVMSYLAFFTNGERKGRRFETWSGTLDNHTIG